MFIVEIIVVLAVVGVGLYLVNTIPMHPSFKKAINAVAILAMVLWLLEAFGLFRYGPRYGARGCR